MTLYLKSFELILNYWQDGYVTTFVLKDIRNWHLYQKEIGQGRINFVISHVYDPLSLFGSFFYNIRYCCTWFYKWPRTFSKNGLLVRLIVVRLVIDPIQRVIDFMRDDRSPVQCIVDYKLASRIVPPITDPGGWNDKMTITHQSHTLQACVNNAYFTSMNR